MRSNCLLVLMTLPETTEAKISLAAVLGYALIHYTEKVNMENF